MTIPKKRRGWTLVELLVVLGCLLVMLALVAPAISQARSASRQVNCKNNLKQVGLALHNYHDTFFSFPPGWTSRHWSFGKIYGYGWPAMLLPFVEQNRLYQQLDFKKPLPATNRLLQIQVPVYRCPADAMPDVNPLRDNYGTSNYSGNYGTRLGHNPNGPSLAHWLSPRRARYWPGMSPVVARTANGMFFHNSSTKIRDMTDGTSNTIMVGERSAKGGAGVWPGITSSDLYGDLVTDCSPGNELNAGFNSFSSYHPGGANFVFGDGRVRFLNDKIDPKIYRAIATRSGGETVGEF